MAILTRKFSEFIDGGDLPNDVITVGLSGSPGANTFFNNPWTFLPDGTTGDRPVPAASMYYRLRFNTSLEVYEYYDPTTLTWTQLSGSGTGTVNPGTTNDLPFYPANGTALSPIASAANSVLVTSAGEVPSLSTTLPIGITIPSAIITSSTAALTSGSVVAAPSAGIDLTNKTYVDTKFASGVTSITGTTNQVIASAATGAVTLSLPQNIATGSTPTFGGMTLTSIPLGSSSGGTGINNGSSTITLGGSLTTSGAFTSTFTMTGNTAVTFPTSGTLLTSSGAVTSITGTANQITASASTGAVTLSIASNPVLPGTGGTTLPTGNTAQQAGIAGTMRFNSQTSVFEGTVDGATWTPFSTAAGTVVSVSGTANRITSTGGLTPVIDISASYVGQSSITTLGTIGTGVWQGTIVTPTYGGTGINNGSNTLTLAGTLATVGAFASSFTMTGATAVTFPTTGTLATTAQLPTPAALTKTDDTNVTLTLGGTPTTALLQATSLTLGWTGQLSVARGGTGLASTTAYAVLCGGTTSTGALQSIASVGTAGQVLTSNGAGALPSMQTITASGTLLNVQTFTASGTYTRTSGATKAVVFCVAGGAGGGGKGTGIATGSGGGGGSGETRYVYITSGLGATETVTIGAGGAGGTAGSTGTAGGTSSFGAHVTCGGGAGGIGTASGLASNDGGAGGSGGSGGTSLVSNGGYPGNGTATNERIGGRGGSSSLSAGSTIQLYGTRAGAAATGYGAGGNGGSNTASSAADGGAGFAGLIIVYEYA